MCITKVQKEVPFCRTFQAHYYLFFEALKKGDGVELCKLTSQNKMEDHRASWIFLGIIISVMFFNAHLRLPMALEMQTHTDVTD